MKFNFSNFRVNTDENGSILVDVSWVEKEGNNGSFYDFPFQFHEHKRGGKAKVDFDGEALETVLKLASCTEDGVDDSAELSKQLETQLRRAYKLFLEVN